MEQSIKSVLVKQTIAHQQQQLTNLQVRCGKHLVPHAKKLCNVAYDLWASILDRFSFNLFMH